MREHNVSEKLKNYGEEPRTDLIEVKEQEKRKYTRTIDGFTGLCFDSNGLCMEVEEGQ